MVVATWVVPAMIGLGAAWGLLTVLLVLALCRAASEPDLPLPTDAEIEDFLRELGA